MKIIYKASPTCGAFHSDNSFFRGLMGPIGSGKSVACVMEIFNKSLNQVAYRGVRKSKWAIVRNTFPQLKTTTIRTWLDWFPEHEMTTMNWSPPCTGRVRYPLSDGTELDLELLFVSLDKPGDVGKVLSLDITGAWFNEAREIPRDIFSAMTGRVGRFPSPNRGGCRWHGIIADTNPPDDDTSMRSQFSWWYRWCEEERPDGYKFFKQPGAMIRDPEGAIHSPLGRLSPNPLAENIANLPGGYQYYINAIAAKDSDWLKVYVMGEYGGTFDGKPVYLDLWDEARHLSTEPLTPYRGLPLILGMDFGLTPACVVCQLSPRGQFRVLREIVCEHGGIREFVRDTVKPLLRNEYEGMRATCFADPAGSQGSQVDEMTCIGEVNRQGITCEAAPSNKFLLRRQAVVAFMTRHTEDGPGFILDPSCITLRKGFNSGYHYNRVQVVGDERYKDTPNKNQYSHVHDALQYAAMSADRSIYSIEDQVKLFPTTSAKWGSFV